MRAVLRSGAGRAFAALVATIAAVTLIALLVLWPGDVDPGLSEVFASDTERAEVTALEEHPCTGFATQTCRDARLRIETGPDEGATTTIPDIGAGGFSAPELEVGDELRVIKNAAIPGVPETGPPQYSLSDFERSAPMLWLAIAFAAIVIVFGRLRGALSLIGLAISLAIVVFFIVPAILDGEEPIVVAIVGSIAVMLATISLAHGLGAKSLAAIVGTTASLLLVAVLAVTFTNLTHLTGLSSEEATILAVNDQGVSFEGLLVAGMVIGALGVLDDVTISQSSTVFALRAANPELRIGQLYRRAIAVGRDHVSATVNTLVLAYVGASLPVLLIFSSSAIGFFDAVTVELVAKEIVAMLVGSIGLIAAVPLTTGFAALLATRLSPEALAGEEAAPAHAH